MEVTEIQTILIFCMELAGTIAFAASGAMVGIHCRMDIFGVCVLGVMTAVGGGMTRDVILGNVPGALVKPVYVLAAVITALLSLLYCIFGKMFLREGLALYTTGLCWLWIPLVWVFLRLWGL